MGDFFCRLHIGLERGFLNIPLPCGAARVNVNGDQRLGLVNHQVAAGFKRHLRFMH
ncbi:MAG: Uncharacterised protein [SAR116 cluster bacterium MED-G04]|nr:MAG: Uncharacterised protein [SAR116 cluster bacterium MED-G04]